MICHMICHWRRMRPGARPRVLAAAGAGRQAGLTLAEVLLVIAVGSVALVNATSLFVAARADQRVNEAYRNTLSLVNAVQENHMGSALIEGDLTPALAGADLAPTSMLDAGSERALANAWNGEVRVIGYGKGFWVEHRKVPESACVKLAARLTNGGAGPSWAANLQALEIGVTQIGAGAFPLDLPRAHEECAESGGRFAVAFGK